MNTVMNTVMQYMPTNKFFRINLNALFFHLQSNLLCTFVEKKLSGKYSAMLQSVGENSSFIALLSLTIVTCLFIQLLE